MATSTRSHLVMGNPADFGSVMLGPPVASSPVGSPLASAPPAAYGAVASMPPTALASAPPAVLAPAAVPSMAPQSLQPRPVPVTLRSAPAPLLSPTSGAVTASGPLSPQRITQGGVARPSASASWSGPPNVLDRSFIAKGEVPPMPSWTVPFVAETFGTFILVLGAGVISATAFGDWVPTGIACLVTALIYMLAPVSGAHLNPAVSLASALAQKSSWLQCWCFFVAQAIGGLLGGWVQQLVLNGKGTTVVTVAPVESFTWGQVFIVEALFTMLLCFVYLSVMTSRRNNPENDQNHFFGHAVGFVYIAAGCAAPGITGGVFLNPVISLGLSLPSPNWPLAYICFEMAGAILAALAYWVCRREDYLGNEVVVDPLTGTSKNVEPRLWSELFGTFILTLTVGLGTLMESDATAWSAGAALLGLSYSLGDVSGAHFNPAVTLSVSLSRRNMFSPWDGLKYVGVQILGAIIGGLLLANVVAAYTPPKPAAAAAGAAQASKPPFGVPSPVFWKGALITIEILGTALVAYTFLAVATTVPRTSNRQSMHPALATCGALVGAGFLALAAYSTVLLNPASALALNTAALVNQGNFAGQIIAVLSFLLWEIVGALLASILFAFTHVLDIQKPSSVFVRRGVY